MISFLNTAAAVVRDVAILAAAGLALVAVVLGLRTRIEASLGSVVVWRLPLFRHVTVQGLSKRLLTAREVADDIDDTAPLTGTAATPETAGEDLTRVTEELPITKTSAWFHIPAAIDRTRDPVELPEFSLWQTRQSKRKRLHLSVTPSSLGGGLSQSPQVFIEDPSGQEAGSSVDLRGPDAGRLQDAIVGGWVSRLWS